MLCCEIILLSVLGLVLGHLPFSFGQPSEDDLLSFETFNTPSPQPTFTSLQDPHESEDDNVMGLCLFGSYPSATCMIECFWKNMSAYCDEESLCHCVTEDDQEDGTEEQKEYPSGVWSFRTPDNDYTASQQPDHEAEEGVMGVCYFGHIPSPSCMFRCSVRGKSAVCDDNSRCLCEERTWRDLIPTTHSPDSISQSIPEQTKNETENGDNGSVFLFVFDLGGLVEPEDSPADSVKSSTTYELWTVPHIIAMAVLSLVAVFLFVEVALCCKRRYSHPCKQHLHTVLTPDGLEKGVVSEKRI